MKSRKGVIKMKRPEFTKSVVVTDNWCPNWEGNRIFVNFSCSKLRDNLWMIRISAYGADDFGMAKMVFTNDKEQAKKLREEYLELFNSIHDGVNVKWFKNRGFVVD
jgi:hypothetical protein